jgi:Tol biopolymer transport system component
MRDPKETEKRKSRIAFGFIFIISSLLIGHPHQDDSLDLRGPYLGQKPPGMLPEVFAKGIVSSSQGVFNAAFSPDGMEFYYSINERGGRETMMFMTRENDRWTLPRPASFVSPQNDCDPIFSHDGKRLYFISTRPKKNDAASSDWDIWYVERAGKGDWSEPINIGPPVNSGVDEYYVSLTSEGTIYFASNRSGGLGSFDIYRSELVDGHYAEPENLGAAINTKHLEHDPFIAPDESYIVFTSVDRPGGFGTGDLYFSTRQEDGTWTKSKNLGKAYNTRGYDFCPILSPDGKYFFFTRQGNIYWIRLEAIKKLF